MRASWTFAAISDVEDIVEHISEDNLDAALALAERMFDTVDDVIVPNPYAGRPGRVAGTREVIMRAPYIIVYRVRNDTIDVLAVRHAARLWPQEF